MEYDKLKPLVIDWLVKRFSLPPYQHSFKDRWMNIYCWNGHLSIGFDLRVPEQVAILNSVPDQYKGRPQEGTGIIVNKDLICFDVDNEWQIEYPTIEGSKIIYQCKHKDNDGDEFWTFDHEMFLSDGTKMTYHNHSPKMDISKYEYRSKIQKRHFFEKVITQNN